MPDSSFLLAIYKNKKDNKKKPNLSQEGIRTVSSSYLKKIISYNTAI